MTSSGVPGPVRSWRWWLWVVLVVVGLVGAGWRWLAPVVVTYVHADLSTRDQLSSVASLWISVASLLVGVVGLVVQVRWVPGEPVGQAVDDLADAVARQWRAEINARGLGHLDPIRIRWSVTSRPVAPARVELLDDRLRLSGDLEDMIRALAEVPVGQLVVIGSPGAGKTTLAVLLTLALARRRQPGDPVPVFMTVASWDPDREHLDTWLVRRLGELYPAFTRRGRYGTDAAVRLVDRGLVMPVLDGLDEMPGPVRAKAITAVTVAVGRDRPMVLTSRANEYQAAVSQMGSPLARAAVVEIEPVTAADAADHLTAGQIDGEARWRPVLAHLAAHPDGALARTLRTPLMVYLARTAYHTPDSDPAALLTYLDPDTIERHLLDAYLPAIYAPRTATPSPQHPPPVVSTYTARQAHRWLAFLADHLTREQTTDLAWWRLRHAIPHFHLVGGLLVGFVVGLAGGLMFGLAGGFRFVLAGGLMAGLTGGFGFTDGLAIMTKRADWLVSREIDTPQQMRISLRQLVYSLAGGLVFGLLFVLAGGLVFGFTGRLVSLFGLVFVVVLVIIFGLGLGGPAALTEAVTPTSTLKNDRKISLVVGCWLALVAGLGFGLIAGLTEGLSGGFVFGLLFGPASMTTAGLWSRFVVARVLLVARTQLPVNLMPFLDDAYRLGVLRQVGAVYQFRHARLQQHLAILHRTKPSHSVGTGRAAQRRPG